jgi:hypothetical protein
MTAAEKKAFVTRMAKGRKKNPSNSSSAKKKAKAKNPSYSHSTARRKKRNPQILGQSPKGLAINILAALFSAVATRQIPQMILGSKNQGVEGYVANVATGAVATFAANHLVGADAANAAMIGAGIIVVDRVLTEKFSPIGNYLALTGLGDATAATRLGAVAEGYYIQPTIYGPDGLPVIPHAFTDAAVQAFLKLQPAAPHAALPAPGMAGVQNKSRFARGIAG